MKLDNLARGGLMAAGLAGLAGGLLLGAAAGYVLARQNPEGVRRAGERAARAAARGIEEASLLAAQAREQVGDWWAEAREHAREATDRADFTDASVQPEASGDEAQDTPEAPARPATKRPSRIRKKA